MFLFSRDRHKMKVRKHMMKGRQPSPAYSSFLASLLASFAETFLKNGKVEGILPGFRKILESRNYKKLSEAISNKLIVICL